MRFSIVIPTYNRTVQLAACLGALRNLEPPQRGDFEVIIVNDGGATPPAEVIASAQDAGSMRAIRLVHRPNSGPAAARNAGVAAARGTYIAFTDDDCLPEPGWLVALDDALTAEPDALVGGRTINAITRNAWAEASQMLADFVAGYFSGGATGRFFASNNMAVAREAFIESGEFDTTFPFSAGEDREFCDRWSAQGRPSALASDAVVRHAHVLTPRGFARQHFTYGRGARAFRRVRALGGRPVRVDPAFYARSVVHPFARGLGMRAPVYALITMGAHVAYAGGLAWESFVRPASHTRAT